MSRKKKELESIPVEDSSPSVRERAVDIVRYTILTVLIVVTVFGAGYGAWRMDQFLRDDGRFRIAHDEPGETVAPIQVSGAKNASRAAILRAFAVDRGRSLYLLNPRERRQQILNVEWVKDASVRREWPNRVAVAVEERIPVAVVPSEPVRLIDADGYFLSPHGKISASYPVLSGLRERDTLEVRRDRVRRMLLLLKALDKYRSHILEVDVTQPESLRMVYQHDDQAITLLLGSENYEERLKHFLAYYPTLKERLPERPTLDLRLDERITIAP